MGETGRRVAWAVPLIAFAGGIVAAGGIVFAAGVILLGVL